MNNNLQKQSSSVEEYLAKSDDLISNFSKLKTLATNENLVEINNQMDNVRTCLIK